LGYKALRGALKNVQLDQDKLDGIIDDKVHHPNEYAERALRTRVRQMVSLAKQYGAWTYEEFQKLADHHALDLNGYENEVYELTPVILEACKKNTKTIDFDDMVWLPKELGVKVPKFDIMLIDEAQDTNISQQWLALEGARRLVVIGDKFQAIYGWRGSDANSIERLKRALAKTKRGVKELPLSYTRRCPKAHVELAQKIVPQIKALDDAPQGVIRDNVSPEVAIEMMRPGDMVLCRVNAELLSVAYALIKKGVKAVIRGRDIGAGVIRLIEQAERKAHSTDLKIVMEKIQEMTETKVRKLREIPNQRGEMRAQAELDKIECIQVIADDVDTLAELKTFISKVFADFDDDGKPQKAVVLGTVHRTKGLEAERIFILRPDLLPHPMAKRAWMLQEEKHIAYVAVTRSVYHDENPGELIFVGPQPKLFCEIVAPTATPSGVAEILDDLSMIDGGE
jgi:superfamily I DNA/RNA helicase